MAPRASAEASPEVRVLSRQVADLAADVKLLVALVQGKQRSPRVPLKELAEWLGRSEDYARRGAEKFAVKIHAGKAGRGNGAWLERKDAEWLLQRLTAPDEAQAAPEGGG